MLLMLKSAVPSCFRALSLTTLNKVVASLVNTLIVEDGLVTEISSGQSLYILTEKLASNLYPVPVLATSLRPVSEQYPLVPFHLIP